MTLEICYLAPEFLPVWGGGGTYNFHMVSELSMRLKIHLLTIERQVPEGKNDEPSSDLHRFLRDHPTVSGNVLGCAEETFRFNALFQYRCFKVLPKLVQQHNIRVIHSFHPPMSDILLKIVRKDLPYFTIVHTTFEGELSGIRSSKLPFSSLEHSERWQIYLQPLLRCLEKLNLARSVTIITASRWMKSILTSRFRICPDKIVVIPNGTNTEMFSPSVKPLDITQFGPLPSGTLTKIILFTGRMRSTKGIHIALKAIPTVVKNFPGCKFLFAGGGFSEPYRKLVEELGLSPKYVSFLGSISHQRLPRLYAASDIFIAPTFYENFPMRIIEAMSSGVPVVASSVCGIPEIVDDNTTGMLLPRIDSECLADGILHLLEDEQECRRMGTRARSKVVRRFSWRRIADMTMEAYAHMLE